MVQFRHPITSLRMECNGNVCHSSGFTMWEVRLSKKTWIYSVDVVRMVHDGL